MLSVYYIGTPLGSALGLMLGGTMGHYFGWRHAFLVAAIPGFLLALLALGMREPPRQAPHLEKSSLRETIFYLAHTPAYLYNLLGACAMTFATGGLAYWFPTFLSRMRGWHLTTATQFFGAITVVAGIAGTMFGGFLADMWQEKSRRSYFYVSAIGMILAAPLAMASILIQNRIWVFPFVFLSIFFLFFNMSPLNAAIISVVKPRMRATAMAMNILFIHLLGDAVSTWAIGRVSDATESLTLGIMIGPAAILLGGLILITGAPALERDQAKLEKQLEQHKDTGS
jgi:predicted MFS family arabinose efflux permease